MYNGRKNLFLLLLDIIYQLVALEVTIVCMSYCFFGVYGCLSDIIASFGQCGSHNIHLHFYQFNICSSRLEAILSTCIFINLILVPQVY